MKRKQDKITKFRFTAIVTAAVIAVVFTALIILNAFIPVKYLTAYTVIKQTREEGEMSVTVLDVGFGDCIVAELPNGEVLMIDGGDGSYQNNLNILRHLNQRGISKIDYLVCSSVKSEHCGGLAEILQYKQVGYAYIPYCLNENITPEYKNFIGTLKKSGVDYGYCGFGEGMADGDHDCFFTFLSPSAYTNPNSEYAALNGENSEENMNNSSAVVWLQYGTTGMAFCSDAGAEALKNMTDDYLLCKEASQKFCEIGGYSVNLEDCEVVLVAGHGDADCTYAEWYGALSPAKAIVSVGKNYYGLPALASLADVSATGAEVLLTSEIGNITVSVNPVI